MYNKYTQNWGSYIPGPPNEATAKSQVTSPKAWLHQQLAAELAVLPGLQSTAVGLDASPAVRAGLGFRLF